MSHCSRVVQEETVAPLESGLFHLKLLKSESREALHVVVLRLFDLPSPNEEQL